MIVAYVLAALLQTPVEEARALLEQGRSLEALQTLDAAAEASPDDPEIQYLLGAVYAAGGRNTEALRHAKNAFTLAPDEPSYALAYGELLYGEGRIDEAKAPLQQASELPEALIAQYPAKERRGSRLLVVDERVSDQRFSDLPTLLRAGDLLVFNDTRVIKARLAATKNTGGRAEILIERVTGERTALAHVRASKSPRPGSRLRLADDARWPPAGAIGLAGLNRSGGIPGG